MKAAEGLRKLGKGKVRDYAIVIVGNTFIRRLIDFDDEFTREKFLIIIV